MSETSIDDVVAEILLSSESSQKVSEIDWIARYPQYESELREFFSAHHRFNAVLQNQYRPMDAGAESNTVPKFFGGYEILEPIDRGGMGIVYKARQKGLKRVVALKVIRSGSLADSLELQRFASETEAVAALSHPGIVQVYDSGAHDGVAYYTMPFIEGQSLSKCCAGEALPIDEAVRIVIQICDAIEHAHQSGVYHRDIKPANVILNSNGQPIVIDFGLAKLAASENDELTATGQILGTPAFMAPEQATGTKRTDPVLCDVYSIGAVLYSLVTGQSPFLGLTPFDVLLQVIDREPALPSRLNRRANKSLERTIAKAMAKNASDRYQSVQEFGNDLRRLLRGEPVQIAKLSLSERLAAWWRRSPILVSHVAGISAAGLIIAYSHWYTHRTFAELISREAILIVWMATCFALQRWVMRVRWREIACTYWAVIDVVVLTVLIQLASPPRALLLVGYPMLIVASSLFYRIRYVVLMASLCIIATLILSFICHDQTVNRADYVAIYISGLGVIGLTLSAIIKRIRGLSRFCEHDHS